MVDNKVMGRGAHRAPDIATDRDIMPRTSTAKILAWGTPPEPEPTGWDAIRIELDKKIGEWANVGEFTSASARKIAAERVPSSDGYETRTAPAKTEGRVDLWVRKLGEIESTEAVGPAPTKRGAKTPDAA